MGDITVKLSRKYEAHGHTFDNVRLREPTGADLDEIGELAERQQSADGHNLIIYHDDRLIAYRKRLLIKGDGLPMDADLAQLSLTDAIAVRDAVSGFFSKARSKLSAERKTD